MAASVRFRLTAMVVVVASLIGGLAATLGASLVEQDLRDAAADADFYDQVLFIEDVVMFSDEVGLVGSFGDMQLLVADLVYLQDLLLDLDEVGVLDAMLTELDTTRQQGVLVLSSFGPVVRVGIEDNNISIVDFAVGADQPDALIAEITISEAWDRAVAPNFEDIVASEGIFDADFLDDVFSRETDPTSFAIDGFEPQADLVFSRREAAGGEFVLVAEFTDINLSIGRLRDLVGIITPILVAIGGLATWFLTGRALRPVHAMTRRVGDISGGNLHERVPEPSTNDEIAELAVTMNSMLDRLEVDDRRLRQFVSDASHELRSPIAVLRSEAEVARLRPEQTTVPDLADGVLHESVRLQQIVEDLLVLARGEETRSDPGFVILDFDDVVLDEASRARRVEVQTRLVSAGRVRGTSDGCRRVVTHLLDNAARHAEDQVSVGLRSENGWVVLWVDDDGPGILPDQRTHIFERFARLDEARARDTGGAGLGLAVVAETVWSMGGTVDVTDATLGGARFTVRIPSASS